MSECLFCRIARKEIPAKLARDEPDVVAFHDIDPKAPVHVLLIPREHIESITEMRDDQAAGIGRLFTVARDLARELGLAESGYRLVINTGPDAGQSVAHVHLHLLGGRHLKWPPG